MKTVRAYLSTLLIAALVFASLPVVAAPTAPQGMDLVSTQSVLAGDRAGADRERINEILARADVQDQLLKQGVNPADVEARVAARRCWRDWCAVRGICDSAGNGHSRFNRCLPVHTLIHPR